MHRQRIILLAEYVRKLLRRNAIANLSKVIAKTHPSDLAQVLTACTGFEASSLLAIMNDAAQRAEVLCELDPMVVKDILDLLPLDEAAEILTEMNTDDAAGILDAMEESRAQQLLDQMEDKESLDVEKLLLYEEETAGRIMTPDFLALNLETTVQEAIDQVRKASETDMIFYLYVVDEHNHLLGVVSLRQLLTTKVDAALKKIMVPEVISVRDNSDQEEVARVVAQYDFLAIPVVNDQNQILGIVTVDDIIDVIKEEATEDILLLAGVDEQEIVSPSIFRSARLRSFWLTVSLAGGLMAAATIRFFEGQTSNFVMLIPFVPVINGMGGNVATQTVTIVVRGLATGTFQVGDFLRILARELAIALILGAGFGLVAGLFGGLSQSWLLGATVALSMCMAVTISTSVAVTMPMVFERAGVDPAIATGPFVTTSIDVLGVVIYFTTAALILP